MIQRKLSRIIIGIGLLSHGTNILFIISGRRGTAPLIGNGPASGYSDPLPQAMALTAIVISFASTAFLLALAYRSWILTDDDEVEDDVTDRLVARGGFADEEVEDASDEGEDSLGLPRARGAVGCLRRAEESVNAALLTLPILLPLLGAGASMIAGRSKAAQRVVALGVLTITTVLSIMLLVIVDRDGTISSQAGGWPAPIGITLVADRLSAIMLVLAERDAARGARLRDRPARRRAQPRRLPVGVPHPRRGRRRVVPHRRPVQPVRRLRDDAHRELRAHHPGRPT